MEWKVCNCRTGTGKKYITFKKKNTKRKNKILQGWISPADGIVTSVGRLNYGYNKGEIFDGKNEEGRDETAEPKEL